MSLFDLNHVPVTEGADQHQNPTPTSPDLFRNCRGDCLSKQSLHHESKQDSVLLLSDESSHPLTLHDTAAADCEQGESHGSDGKWTMMPSSEMRIMKKMIMVMMTTGCQDSRPRGSMQIVPKGQSQADDTSCNNCSVKSASCSSSSIGGVVRACTNCNTTRTPLWRTGPYGPKSLCNACGIRQRKARRAMEAAALKRGGGGEGGGGLALDAPNNRLKKEEKSSMIYHTDTVPFKKRCKFKYSSSLSSSNVHDQEKKIFPQVLPKDERDAAMLLMGLSCGLIRSNL